MADETRDVVVSFEKRVESELSDFSIHWQGTDFDEQSETGTDIQEWIQAGLLGFTGSPTRNGERAELWTADFNAYSRMDDDSAKGTRRVWEIADAVLTAFGQHDLDVGNWGSGDGTTEIGRLRFSEGNVTPVPSGVPLVSRLNITFTASFIL